MYKQHQFNTINCKLNYNSAWDAKLYMSSAVYANINPVQGHTGLFWVAVKFKSLSMLSIMHTSGT